MSPILSFLFGTCLGIFLGTSCFAQIFQWAKQMGSTGWDEGTSIVTDQDHQIYVLGLFQGTVDMDPGPGIFALTSVGEKDAFICKLDADGDFVWAKQYGDSAAIDEKGALAIDSLGNLYTTNSFVGKVDMNPGPDSFVLTSQGWDRDIFIQKLDKDGNFLWAKQISAQPSWRPAPVHSNAIAVDDNSNLYLTGYFDGTVDFDPDSSTSFEMEAPMTNGFVCKLDANGGFVWAKEFEGGFGVGAVGYAIAVDGDQQVYTTGTVGGTVDFDPGPGTFFLTPSDPFAGEAYLSKLDASGNFVWAKALGPGIGYALAVDEQGNAYCGNAHSGGANAIAKFDGPGNLVWSHPLEGTFGLFAMSTDHRRQLYVSGSCCIDTITVDLDPGPSVYSLTGSGTFISRYDSLGNFGSAGLLENSQVHALTSDQADNVYATGYFWDATDFDLGPSTFDLQASHYDVFVLKLTSPETVGVDEQPKREQVKVYPNPTAGKLRVEFDQTQSEIQLVLRNLLGQSLLSTTVSDSHQADMSIQGSSGVYLLEVFDEQHRKTVLRLVKK
ncbi:MAG: T9SS type A sorting domain-containing protein [Bacteroidota bacterium]